MVCPWKSVPRTNGQMQYCRCNTVGRTNSPVLGLSGRLSGLQYCVCPAYCIASVWPFVRPTVLHLSGLLYCVCPAVCPAYYTAIGFVLPTVLRFCPAYCTAIGFVRPTVLLFCYCPAFVRPFIRPFVRPTVLRFSPAYCIAFVCLSVVRILTDKPYFFTLPCNMSKKS
jgi:hypothetical protein